ncbi:MAG: choice-of-anchor E domain-containing protein [Caldilineaceae bacterium]|nr:choice-of-anchor E domain-containing protein [Caldilineaceae bacterium]
MSIDHSTFPRSWSILLICLCAMVGIGFAFDTAHAETIVLSDTIPTKTTNWSDELTIPAFQSAWGELTAITITIETPIAGSVNYENTSNETVLITSTHAVSISLQMLDKSVMKVLPAVVRSDVVPPYDGVSDFQGTSGNSFTMNTTLSVSKVYTASDVLALFYGTEPLHFPITAVGASYVQGPGNFDAILRAQAAGVLFTVYFDYLPLKYEVKKLTNGHPADSPNGGDLPVVFPGAPITWTYLISNTGQMPLTLNEIVVVDSDPTVNPQFDPTSDDGDLLLAPGEIWRYLAFGVALNLQTAPSGPTIVAGCLSSPTAGIKRAYQNEVTVMIRNNSVADWSHYCNPTQRLLEPGIAFKKYVNGADADGPNDPDVPLLTPGALITWTYLLTNTGDITFPLAQVRVTDDDASLTVLFDATSDDGDKLLAPGEQWRYYAIGVARNLTIDISGITTVPGCGLASPEPLSAYRNIGTVTINQLSVSDPSHYCNFTPTSVRNEETNMPHMQKLYLPVIAK